MKQFTFLSGPLMVLIVLLAWSTAQAVVPVDRAIPRPLDGHPGNIFLAGEEVVVGLPQGGSDAWRAVDYDGKAVAQGRGGPARLGRLPVGYYELLTGEETPPPRRISVGVLAPLAVPTPATSPIAVDVAMAWFYKENQMPAVANLCALAGMNWVRDRLSWAEMEKERGKPAPSNRYDASAAAQASAGLQVLQVNHSSPAWAGPNHKRFPLDLRDAHRFHKDMAARWRTSVAAFEPWNEADIVQFGGHTGSEIAAMQKASYLGLKAGNPRVIVCQNVFAVNNRAILDDFRANEPWPFFDTFNLHHYAPVDRYPSIYADFRAVSGGKPLWVTEFNVPVHWSGDKDLKEPSDADLRVQAQRVAKVFAGSLHEGATAAFYFLLPHYVEGQVQFGVIRRDLTPRPAMVSLAAVGRLLADARPAGRLKPTDRNVRGFIFLARPDGQERLVMVAWAEKGKSTLTLGAAPLAVYDHLGRAREKVAAEIELGPAPVFLFFSADARGKFDLEPPPAQPQRINGKPSSVVLQTIWPESRVALGQSAYRISAEKAEQVPLFVYNFGPDLVEGRLKIAAPKGWKVSVPDTVKVGPSERVELAINVDLRETTARQQDTVLIRGNFGPAGESILSLRLQPEIAKER